MDNKLALLLESLDLDKALDGALKQISENLQNRNCVLSDKRKLTLDLVIYCDEEGIKVEPAIGTKLAKVHGAVQTARVDKDGQLTFDFGPRETADAAA